MTKPRSASFSLKWASPTPRSCTARDAVTLGSTRSGFTTTCTEPGAPDYPSMEAWTLATALLSQTERIQVGHMLLCNQFRHPAVLAEDGHHAGPDLGGRLQLGIGSGSLEDEHTRVGLDWGTFASVRTAGRDTGDPEAGVLQMNESTFAGKHFTVRDMPIKPGRFGSPGRRSSWAASARSTRCRWLRAMRCVERAHLCAG